jgi:hypothetical protein
MTRTATCCCGGIAVTVTGDPVLNAVCHCGDCRRRSGSVMGWNVYFPEAQVEAYGGTPQTYSPKRDPEQLRRFCTVCGSTLWWTSPFRPGEIGMAGGAFVSPALPAPDQHAQGGDCLPWIMFRHGLWPYPWPR